MIRYRPELQNKVQPVFACVNLQLNNKMQNSFVLIASDENVMSVL